MKMTDCDTYRIDEHGRLCGAQIHDSTLKELKFSNNECSLHIEAASISGKGVCIEFLGLTQLTVAEFWDGAILSDIYVWNIFHVPEICWKIPDGVWNILFKNRLTKEDAPKLAMQIAAKHPDALVIQVELSYGGAIAAICRNIEIDGKRLDLFERK